jgi:ferric-dicitrate binding protein FerR (iron transport regulator)
MLSEEEQHQLVLHLGGMADEATSHQCKELLETSEEARVFAAQIRRITSALEFHPEHMKPLSDEEMEPWRRLWQERFGASAVVRDVPRRRWILHPRFWLLSGAAAGLLIVVGLWQLRTVPPPAKQSAKEVGHMWLMRVAAEVSSGRGLTERGILAGEAVDIGDNGAKIGLDGTTIWARPKSRFTVSQDGGTFEIQNGAFLLDTQDGARPLVVTAGSGRAALARSVLVVDASAAGVKWELIAGQTLVQLRTGDLALKPGEAVAELHPSYQTRRTSTKANAYPGWVQRLKDGFENRAGQEHKQ